MHPTSYLTYSNSIHENKEETFIFPHFLTIFPPHTSESKTMTSGFLSESPFMSKILCPNFLVLVKFQESNQKLSGLKVLVSYLHRTSYLFC